MGTRASCRETGPDPNWEDPGPGGFYDDLGNATRQPHLVPLKTWEEDPGRVESAQEEYSWHDANRALSRGGGRLSWQDQAQTLYGTPLRMRYEGLDPKAEYTVRAMYVGRFRATMTLTADDTVRVHGPLRSGGLDPVAFTIPRGATADGTLELSWDLVEQRGCQVAEVWLTQDECPADPNKTVAGACGCGVPETPECDIPETEDEEEPDATEGTVQVDPRGGPAPLTVRFDASTIPNATRFSWDFGLGRTGTGPIITHVFTRQGSYTVRLVAATDTGAEVFNRALPEIVVTAPAVVRASPTAAITLSALQGDAPLSVTFSGGASADPDGNIVEYRWDFGDGTPPDDRLAGDHVFAAPGTYRVRLTVENAAGQTHEATATVVVSSPSPPAASTSPSPATDQQSTEPVFGIPLFGNCGFGVLMAMATTLLGLTAVRSGPRRTRPGYSRQHRPAEIARG